MKIIAEHALYDGSRYLGLATQYENGQFVHSLLCHAIPTMLPTLQTAAIDFRRIYDELPSKVRGGPDRKYVEVRCGASIIVPLSGEG